MMIGKKTCSRCGKSLNLKYDFCPFCGNMLEKKEKDFGMLGKTDSSEEGMNMNGILPFGLNSIFNSLMRNLEKQLGNQDKERRPDNRKGNLSISISTLGGFPQQMKVNPVQESKGEIKRRNNLKKFFFDNFSSESFKKFSKLPRVEPKVEIRRIGDKISCEVMLPGVKSVKDISIMRLESSMELKAVAEKKAYMKTIPLNFPIEDYKFLKGKLTLELDAKGN